MKKLVISMLLIASAMLTFGQPVGNGLHEVFVERIPVSAAADAADPNLNANSVTYRIFVRMQPNFVLSAVSGEWGNPGYFQASAQIYNHANGITFGKEFTTLPAVTNPLYYDSWLTIGAIGRSGAASQIVPLAEDNVGAVDGFVPGGVANATFGDPATNFDRYFGFEMATSAGTATGNTTGWDIENWAYYAAGGVAGVTATNTVCIGQITTDGDLTFEVILLLVPMPIGTGPARQFVYRESNIPGNIKFRTDEVFFTTVNNPPVVNLTAPAAGSTFIAGNVVNMAATASDTDGTITRVEFLVDGVVVGQDLDAPYVFPWTSTTGNRQITARATDNGGRSTVSSPVTIIVNEPPVNVLPVATITAPANSTSYDVRDVPTATINIAATASDADGTVTLVEFFVNGAKVGEDPIAPYAWIFSTTNIGSYALTVQATDNLGVKGAVSAPVNVTVINTGVVFQLGENRVDSVVCHSSAVFCVPVKRINTGVTNATGFDFELVYDYTLVTPTGKVFVSNDMTNERQTATYFRQEGTNKIYVGVYFAEGTATFNGTGDILCVEFARNIGFDAGERAQISLTSITTSYSNLPAVRENLPGPYTYTTYNNTVFEGSLDFWADNSPISGGPGFARTEIVSSVGTYRVEPNVNGIFLYDISRGSKQFNFVKTNPGAPSEWNDPVRTKLMWSSYDALLTQRVIVNDPTFIPNVFQIIAMDINRDAVVTAGDITQIMRRSVESINDFVMVSGQRKWDFLALEKLNSELRYRISNTWPADDGVGFSKNRVPQVENSYTINSGDDVNCAIMVGENFKAILKGDVDGSWARMVPDAITKSAPVKSEAVKSNSLQIDLASASMEENFINIPVRLFASEMVQDLDIVLSYNGAKLFFESIVSHDPSIVLEANNINDQHISIASISNEPFPVEEKLFTLRFFVAGEFKLEDITNVVALIEGVEVATSVTPFSGDVVTLVEDNFDLMLKVYPNPVSDVLSVELPESAQIQLISVTGEVVYTRLNANGVEKIDVKGIASGVYMLKVTNNNVSVVRQVVVK